MKLKKLETKKRQSDKLIYFGLWFFFVESLLDIFDGKIMKKIPISHPPV